MFVLMKLSYPMNIILVLFIFGFNIPLIQDFQVMFFSHVEMESLLSVNLPVFSKVTYLAGGRSG